MKPALFDYVAPQTLAEAVAALATDDTARPLAGGQSLIPTMNFRLSTPGKMRSRRWASRRSANRRCRPT